MLGDYEYFEFHFNRLQNLPSPPLPHVFGQSDLRLQNLNVQRNKTESRKVSRKKASDYS